MAAHRYRPIAGSHSPHGECGLKCCQALLRLPVNGHFPHGECGLKWPAARRSASWRRHSPHGECGLKSYPRLKKSPQTRSLPAWGVRVEICFGSTSSSRGRGHSPHGECGLKFARQADRRRGLRHSPLGECGLKLVIDDLGKDAPTTLPAWGVRVELCNA